VLRVANARVIVGDMREVLGKLNGGAPVSATYARTPTDLKSRVEAGLTKEEMNLWRLGALVSVGVGGGAVDLAATLPLDPKIDSEYRFELLRSLARAHFHCG